MKRNLYVGILLGSLWIVLAGCATSGDEATPEETLSLYISAYLNGRYEEAYQYLSSEDRKTKSLEAYVGERMDAGTFLAGNLQRFIRCNIREVTLVDERHARGKAEFRIPDYRAMVGEVSRVLQSAADPESALDHISFARRTLGAFEKKYQTEGIPETTLQENFDLVREDRRWKVRAGWVHERVKESGKP